MTATAVQIAPSARRPAPGFRAAVPSRISVRNVRFRENGVEFLSSHALPLWAELELGSGLWRAEEAIEATAVVVGCRRQGSEWQVCLLFLRCGGAAAQEIQWLTA